jgi:hypothetical protein
MEAANVLAKKVKLSSVLAVVLAFFCTFAPEKSI